MLLLSLNTCLKKINASFYWMGTGPKFSSHRNRTSISYQIHVSCLKGPHSGFVRLQQVLFRLKVLHFETLCMQGLVLFCAGTFNVSATSADK